MPVSDISDEDLVRRAVRNARPREVGIEVPRWSAIGETFGLGSTYATELCRRFGLDPHEQLTGPVCVVCVESQVGNGEEPPGCD